MATWPTETEAALYLDVPTSGVDHTRLSGAFNAAVEAVAEDCGLLATPGTDIPAYVREGTLLLIARMYARKSTPLGVQGFTQDYAAYIMRSDPDVAALIGRAFSNWAIG